MIAGPDVQCQLDRRQTAMTYRERREARAARLREWADKREAKSDAALEQARTMGEAIPFGQPILMGHHSQGRDMRYRARIESTTRRGFEHADKARSMASRADNIEGQLAGAIYSDDPDAIEALEVRLSTLEAERDRIKAYNASCRKGARDTSLLDEKQQRDLVRTAQVAPYSLGKNGAYPGYHLTNLSGNIARNRKRLDALKAQS